MANIKKPKGERKKSLSSSLKEKTITEFLNNCSRLAVNPSHKVEELIINYNNEVRDQ